MYDSLYLGSGFGGSSSTDSPTTPPGLIAILASLYAPRAEQTA